MPPTDDTLRDPFEVRLSACLRSHSHAYEEVVEAYWHEQWQELATLPVETLATLYQEQGTDLDSALRLPAHLRRLKTAASAVPRFSPWQPVANDPWQRVVLACTVGSLVLHSLLLGLPLPEVPPPAPASQNLVLVEAAKPAPSSPAKSPEPARPTPKPPEKPSIAKSAPEKAYASRKILTATAPDTANQGIVSNSQLESSRGTGFGDSAGTGDSTALEGTPARSGGRAKQETLPLSPPLPVPARPQATVIPDYPEIAQQNGWEGRVIVRAYISAEGTVGEAEISRSSGHQELDEAALVAVRRAQFEAATRNGLPVASWIKVPISFALQ